MRKKLTYFLVFILCVLSFVPSNVIGIDFEAEEDKYRKLCNGIVSKEDYDVCVAFQEYLNQKANDLKNEADKVQDEISKVKGDINKVMAKINQFQTQIRSLDAQIDAANAAIALAEENIRQVELDILETEKNIEIRENQIKDRMVETQPTLGVNAYIDFVMGAEDFVDLVRRISGIQQITEADQEQIAQLEKEKKQLEEQKVELERQKEKLVEDKANIETNKASLEKMKAAQNELLAEYQGKSAELEEMKRNVKVNIDEIRNNMPIFGLEGTELPPMNNSGWVHPVRDYGTYVKTSGAWTRFSWGGGIHLGNDFGSYGAKFIPLVACTDAVVLYASNNYASNGGYLGNWVGNPAGAGNNVMLVGRVNGGTYVYSYSHMARENFYVKGKTTVRQGEVIGYMGNSGNSTGTHLHFDIIYMGNMSIDEVVRRFRNTGDFSFGTGWGNTGYANRCERKSAPCRYRPENVI